MQVFERVADGLVHMHRRGVYHSDLKPNNILLSRAGDVKIIDFGLARIKGETKDRVQGTPEYIAPEQAKHKMVNERTDIYNFGATMYRMLTFRLPPCVVSAEAEGGLPIDGKIWRNLFKPVDEFNAQAPAGLCELVHRCLSYEAVKRPERMAKVQEKAAIDLPRRNARQDRRRPPGERRQGMVTPGKILLVPKRSVGTRVSVYLRCYKNRSIPCGNFTQSSSSRSPGPPSWPASIPRPVPFRPPAVPLVACDPYLSIWSMADRLTDDSTRHWTRRPHPLVSLIRIDGKTYRLMGAEPKDAPAFPQKSVEVFPTRSVYEFADGHIHVTLTFMTAALPDDLEVLSRPLSYITWLVRSVDGAAHAVSIYDSTSSLLAVNEPGQKVEWARETIGNLTALRTGTQDQPLLTPAGDDTRIDWGYVYAAAPTTQATAAVGAQAALTKAFLEDGKLPGGDDKRMPRAANDDQPVLAFVFDLGRVGAEPVSRHLIVAYDEIWSIKYFGKKLRPYWRRDGATPADLLRAAERDYPSLVQTLALRSSSKRL